MAAPTIPPIRVGLTAAFLPPVAGHPDRTFVVDENFFYRDDLRYARALIDGLPGQHISSSASFAA